MKTAFLRQIPPAPVLTARVMDAFGKGEKKLPGSSRFQSLSVGERLPAQTTLRTGEGAALLIELPDRHLVRVGAKTTVQLNKLGQDKEFALKVLAGQIWSLVKKANHPAKFTVETTSGVAGVTGTFFGVAIEEETGTTIVSTGEGSVLVQSLDDQGQAMGTAVPVTQGMMTRVHRREHAGPARRQPREHLQMWQTLYREGAWAQQHPRGPLHLRRGNERMLQHFLHPPPPHR